jgi:hypothetical protein
MKVKQSKLETYMKIAELDPAKVKEKAKILEKDKLSYHDQVIDRIEGKKEKERV